MATDTVYRVFTTWKPEKCGLATFGDDAFTAVDNAFPTETRKISVTAIDSGGHHYALPVDIVIDKYNSGSWKWGIAESMARMAALEHKIPEAAMVVYVNHEFGLNPLLESGKDPVDAQGRQTIDILDQANFYKFLTIVQAHTISPNPVPHELKIMQEIAKRTHAIISPTRSGETILKERYGINAGQGIETIVDPIPHGIRIQDPSNMRKDEGKRIHGNLPRYVVSNTGFQAEDKGSLAMWEAWGLAVKEMTPEEVAESLLLVGGGTHPGAEKDPAALKKFREDRKKIISDYELKVKFLPPTIKALQGVDTRKLHAVFLEGHLEVAHLLEIYRVSDVSVTANENPGQISSGPTSDSRGTGNAVVSTLAVHSYDSIAPFQLKDISVLDLVKYSTGNKLEFPIIDRNNPRGAIVQPKRPDQISKAILIFMRDRELLYRTRANTLMGGQLQKWNNYAHSLDHLVGIIKENIERRKAEGQ